MLPGPWGHGGRFEQLERAVGNGSDLRFAGGMGRSRHQRMKLYIAFNQPPSRGGFLCAAQLLITAVHVSVRRLFAIVNRNLHEVGFTKMTLSQR